MMTRTYHWMGARLGLGFSLVYIQRAEPCYLALFLRLYSALEENASQACPYFGPRTNLFFFLENTLSLLLDLRATLRLMNLRPAQSCDTKHISDAHSNKEWLVGIHD